MPLMRRRRPLLRAAATAGAGYMAGKRHAANEQREYEQDARLSGLEQQGSMAPPPPPPAPAAGGLSPESMEQLKSLAQLHEQGILTDQEFEQQKAKILGS